MSALLLAVFLFPPTLFWFAFFFLFFQFSFCVVEDVVELAHGPNDAKGVVWRTEAHGEVDVKG